ncbi:MAG: hypothetical protein K6C98_06135 [Treponema sp.]|nr:hypothetical protein [Treponema sp.]
MTFNFSFKSFNFFSFSFFSFAFSAFFNGKDMAFGGKSTWKRELQRKIEE